MTHHEWKVRKIIQEAKNRKWYDQLDLGVWIRSVTNSDGNTDKDRGWDLIGEITKWRSDNMQWFPSQFKANRFRTQSWFRKHLMDRPDRLLFLIFDNDRNIGHAGLSSFNFDTSTCEIDNVVRGQPHYPGIIGKAINWIVKQAYDILEMKNVELRTFSDNERAIRLYERCGFRVVDEIPLSVAKHEKEITYEPAMGQNIDRYNLRMKHVR